MAARRRVEEMALRQYAAIGVDAGDLCKVLRGTKKPSGAMVRKLATLVNGKPVGLEAEEATL